MMYLKFVQIAFLGLVMLVLVGCKNELSEISALYSKDDIGVEKARNVEIIYSDSAVMRVKIIAPTLLRYTDKSNPHESFPDGLEVEFFDEEGITTSTLTSKDADRYEREGKIIVRDSVVWISNTNERLESEELIWDEKSEKVHTNKFVTIRRPDEIIYGYGFEATQNFTRSRIRAVEGRLKTEDFDK